MGAYPSPQPNSGGARTFPGGDFGVCGVGCFDLLAALIFWFFVMAAPGL